MNTALAADALAGRLQVRPGRGVPALDCERPVLGTATMQALVGGRHAALLPDLLGAVFTLCAPAHRMTSRRALRAALGLHDDAQQQSAESLRLHLATAREHLQRLAIDTPGRAPLAGLAADAGWVRDAPVMDLADGGSAPHGADRLRAAGASLAGWLERRLLGRPVAGWLADWQAAPLGALAQWCAGHAHPVTRWLAAATPVAADVGGVPVRPLPLPGGDAAVVLAGRIASDAGFVRRPQLDGPVETGPWTRAGWPPSIAAGGDLMLRHGARIADLAQIACALSTAAAAPAGDGAPGWLRFGARTVGDGEGLAWTEMSRGVLVHWVRLAPGWRDLASARVADCRVLAPTEWNFHPGGALSTALSRRGLDEAAVRVAVTALDPCVAFDIAWPTQEPVHA